MDTKNGQSSTFNDGKDYHNSDFANLSESEEEDNRYDNDDFALKNIIIDTDASPLESRRTRKKEQKDNHDTTTHGLYSRNHSRKHSYTHNSKRNSPALNRRSVPVKSTSSHHSSPGVGDRLYALSDFDIRTPTHRKSLTLRKSITPRNSNGIFHPSSAKDRSITAEETNEMETLLTESNMGQPSSFHHQQVGEEQGIETELVLVDDKGWTAKTNLLLIVWLSRCASLLTSHNKRLRRTKIAFIVITVFYIIINTFSSSLSFLNVGTSDPSSFPPDPTTSSLSISGTDAILVAAMSNETSFTSFGAVDSSSSSNFDYASYIAEQKLQRNINIVIGVSTMVTAMIAGIIAFLKLGDAMVKEKVTITKLSKLVREIEMVIYADIEDRPEAKKFLSALSEKYYRYHNLGEVVEENIMDWKTRVQEAAKMNNSCFPNDSVYFHAEDIKEDGRIRISENVIRTLQRSHTRRRNSPKSNNSSEKVTPVSTLRDTTGGNDTIVTEKQQQKNTTDHDTKPVKQENDKIHPERTKDHSYSPEKNHNHRHRPHDNIVHDTPENEDIIVRSSSKYGTMTKYVPLSSPSLLVSGVQPQNDIVRVYKTDSESIVIENYSPNIKHVGSTIIFDPPSTKVGTSKRKKIEDVELLGIENEEYIHMADSNDYPDVTIQDNQTLQ